MLLRMDKVKDDMQMRKLAPLALANNWQHQQHVTSLDASCGTELRLGSSSTSSMWRVVQASLQNYGKECVLLR
jgi:hypothetical protein